MSNVKISMQLYVYLDPGRQSIRGDRAAHDPLATWTVYREVFELIMPHANPIRRLSGTVKFEAPGIYVGSKANELTQLHVCLAQQQYFHRYHVWVEAWRPMTVGDIRMESQPHGVAIVTEIPEGRSVFPEVQLDGSVVPIVSSVQGVINAP